MVEILKKRLKISDLNKIRQKYKFSKIGLCHGGFDILHYGHILHLKQAKSKVNKLVVSITGDKFIKKGPNNPYNNEELRARYLEELPFIDFVYIDQNLTAKEVIKYLKPNLYFKGKDYLDKDITGNLSLEVKELKKNKGKIFLTNTDMLSSTKIINHLSYKDSENLNFLKKINIEKINKEIKKSLDYLKKIEINIIGEPIIDSYVFCKVVGITSKDPAISTIEEKILNIPGGVLAIAKIASKFCKKINLFTYGQSDLLKNFFKEYSNIKIINFSNKILIQKKTRYINSNRYEKLLQVSNFEKNDFNLKKRKLIKRKLSKIKSNLIICDFGNNLLADDTLKYINSIKINKYVNVQSNSLNSGYNLFTKYNNLKYLSLDEKEWKLGLRSESITSKNIRSLFNKNIEFSITKGKNGSTFFDKKNNEFSSPVFIDKVIDTTGCGDAYFIITSLLMMSNFAKEFIPFMGNVYAGMHSQYVGNSKIIDKISYQKYLNSILKL